MDLEINIENKAYTPPLVSIIVVTYNSSKYVLETLESAKSQNFINLELIISDDCSTDDTVEICKRWIKKNESRFVKTELITVEKNTGIPANCNRGVEVAKGEWLKLIAGDDLLLPNCIEDYIDFANKNKEFRIFISRFLILKDGTLTKSVLTERIKRVAEAKDAQDQYKILLINYFGSSPSLFVSQEIFKVIKFDERFRFIEDYPFALNVTKMGFRYALLDKETVIYRKHESSVFGSISKNIIFNDFYLKRMEFDKIYRHPFLPKKIVKKELFEYQRCKLLDMLNLNHRNIFCRVINKITSRLNPYVYND